MCGKPTSARNQRLPAANDDGSTPIKKSWEVRQGKDVKNKVLVAGASGLIGAAAIETFLAARWDVIGISRRKSELSSGRDFRFIPAHLRDEKAACQALSPLADTTHVAYAAICENADDLVGGWSNSAQIEANNAMLRNAIEPLSGTPDVQTITVGLNYRFH
jgi:nucleoside-diphosphate-sugar epimerase